jgi:hypothetical protein
VFIVFFSGKAEFKNPNMRNSHRAPNIMGISSSVLVSPKNPHQLRRFIDESYLPWKNLLGAIFSAKNPKVLQRTLKLLE